MSKFTDFANVATRPGSGLFLVGYEGTEEKRIETPALLAGLAPLTENKSLALTPDALTGSSATSALDISQTWNTTGNPTAVKVNITNNASGASSLLMDLQVNNTSFVQVLPNGVMNFPQAGANINAAGNIGAGSMGTYPYFALNYPTGKLAMHRVSKLAWAGSGDYLNPLTTFLGSGGDATIQLGEDHATAPVAQFLQGPAATSGNNNGGPLTIRGGAGSGSGRRGAVTIDSRWRTQVPTTDPLPLTVIALLDHGLMLPPDNGLSDISADSSSATVNITGLDLGITNSHRIEVQYSADNSTWLSAGIEYNTNTDIFFGIGGLDSSTLYYLRWRSIAPNNNDVFGAWQNTTFNTSE